MKERILKFGRVLFPRPSFIQNESDQIARQIYPILWSQVVSVGVLGIVLSILVPSFVTYWILLALATIAISLFLLALTRRRLVRLAAVLLIGQLWSTITVLSWSTSGLGSRAAWGYFIVVFIAGMLLGGWSGAAAAVVCSLSTLWLAIASPVHSSDPARFWLINSLYLVLVLMLQNLASRSSRESLQQARHELHERRQAEKEREAIISLQKATIESTADGILVIDHAGKITDFNRRFAQMWRIPDSVMDNRDDAEALKFVLDQFVDPEEFTAKVRELYATPERESFDLLSFKDGRCFERYSRPQMIAGRPVGRVWSFRDVTERTQAENSLLESNQFISSLLRALPVAVFFKDREGRYTGCNDAFSEIMGVRSEEIKGKTVHELWPSALADTYHRMDLDLMRDRKHQVYEYQVKDKDGHIRPVIYAKDVIYDADGEVSGLVGAFLDITARKKAEEALRESEEKYRLTMDVAPIGIYIIQDLRFKFVNPEMARMHGYTPEEMTDSLSPPDALVAPEHREMVRQTLLRRQEGVRGQPYEIRAMRRDGSLFDALVWGQGITFNGKPASVGTLLDISERKLVEEALKGSEQRYRTLFEAASDSIFVMKDNLFFDCNSRTLEMFGCQRDQIIGLSPDKFSPPFQPDGRSSPEKAQEKIDAAYAGTAQFFEWLHCRLDGTPFMTEVSLNRFHLGPEVHLLAIVRDIADRKVLEEQLRQAQKMEAVGILAGGVAHDFNNILSTIVGYASLLHMQTSLDKKLKEYLERILASTERAASLTHSLLAFSRKQAIELRPVDINDSIFGFHKVLARLIGEDIEFKLDLSSENLVVDADIRQIEQVLMNLATNARDAMPGGGKLTITTRSVLIENSKAEMADGPYAVISVRDTGTGMDKEIQSHLFEPFYTTKEVGKGTGLGLAIVYGIVKNHRGFIKMESTFTQGTAFHIYLPLKFQPLKKLKRKAAAKIPRGHETILLVEDDAAVRHATRSMLEEFGYTVLEAADGQEALAVFASHRASIDLLLSDLIMPKMNGKETRAGIMNMKPGIKTIFMSGYTSDIIARRGILESEMHLLLKPLHPAALLEKIREVLDS